MNALGHAFGLEGDSVSNAVFAIAGLDLALRILAGTSIRRVIQQLRTFIQLIRESQRATIAGRLLEALSAAFPAIAALITRAIAALRRYITVLRNARRENQLYAASNIAASFSGIVQPIGLAIEALLRYIARVRAARRENQLLAASNLTLGFSGLAGGAGGLLGGLGGLLGGLRGLATRGLATLVGGLDGLGASIARLGAVGTVGAIVGISIALNKFGEEVDKLVPQLKRLDDFMARFIGDDAIIGGIKRIATHITNLGPDPFGLRKFFQERGAAVDTTALSRMGSNVVRALNGVAQGVRRAGTSVFTAMGLTLDTLQTQLNSFGEKIQNLVDSLQRIQDTAGDFIRAQIESKPVPAQAALDRLDHQETVRDRAQRRRDANEEFQQAQRQQRLANQSLETALGRLARLRARLLGGGRVATTAGGRDVFRSADPLTPAQRRATQEAIRAAQEVVRQRRQELQDARQQVIDVGKARRETLRQVALEERREVLERQAQLQEEQRQKEIDAAQKRANDAIEAYIKAIESGKVPLTKARAALVDTLAQVGVPREQTRAWLRGKKLGEDFQTGFADSLADFSKNLTTLIGRAIDKQHLKAPVIIVTDAPTIRRVINRTEPPTPPNPDRFSRPSGGHPGPGGAAGLVVPGGEGAAVPIVAHAGEWVLNRSQQLRAALMAGMDRTVLERALFHLAPTGFRTNFALGGTIVPSQVDNLGHTFLTPVNIQTSSTTVDADYVARALESRMRTVVGR
jgi:hypothetical protein